MARVLCYDPDPVLREAICRRLGADGSIETLDAGSFNAAMEALRSLAPDAVVTDLPDEEVVTLLGIVRRFRGPIPVLLFMHPGRERIALEAMNSGARQYLEKDGPSSASLAALDEAVRRVLLVDQESLTRTRRAENLEFLSRAAMDFVRMEDDDDIYAYIAEGVRELVPEAWVVVSSFDTATRLFTCRAFAGTDEDRRVFDEELGSSPVGFRFSIDNIPSAESVFSCPSVMEAPSSFQHISFWTVPEEVCGRIDERLTIGRAYTMSFLCRGGLYGAVTFRLRKGMELEDRELVEAFIGQASVALLRHHARERLRESEARYRAVVESQQELICRFRPDGTHLVANEAYCRFFGLDPGQIIGGRFMPEVPEEERVVLDRYFRGFSREASESTIEHRVVLPDGRVRWLQWQDRAFFDSTGTITEFQSVGRDVTERKEAEASLAALTAELERRVEGRTAELQVAVRDLESFTSSVSHDLRAPLRAIDGYLGILTMQHQEGLSADQIALVDRARDGVRRAGRFIEGLLSLSRLSRQPLALEWVETEKLVRAVIGELLPDPGDRRVEIVVGCLPPCRADPEMLRHVYQNLLSNALKFTGKCDPARIDVSAGTDGDETVYTVADNGVGFPAEVASRVFDDFARFHDAREYEGSGIGLPLVRRIVERHGGRCWAEGESGTGAAFFFTLGPAPAS